MKLFKIKTRSGNVLDRRSDDPIRSEMMHGLSREGVQERIMQNHRDEKIRKRMEELLRGKDSLPKGMSSYGWRYRNVPKGDRETGNGMPDINYPMKK